MDVQSQPTGAKLNTCSRVEILRKIEGFCLHICKSICSGECPELVFPRHSAWAELGFNDIVVLRANSSDLPLTRVRLDRPTSAKKFSAMLKILKLVYCLIQENRFCTKRDIFYQYPDLYNCQRSIDKIVDDIACMLQVPRWDLHILATSKGLVAGDLLFQNDDSTQFDCSTSTAGVQIPSHLKDMQNIQSNARFVLIVEKDATFQKLIGQQFCQKHGPCILITGKGFPDNGTQLLLRQLWLSLCLPMFVLVDADPHGMEIMAVYRFGSMNQAHENQYLATPSVKWLGILPEDISRLHIPQSALIPLSPRDIEKCKSLKIRPYSKEDPCLIPQVETVLQLGVKAEIQCLDAIGSTYLCDVYLPHRINKLLQSNFAHSIL